MRTIARSIIVLALTGCAQSHWAAIGPDALCHAFPSTRMTGKSVVTRLGNYQ